MNVAAHLFVTSRRKMRGCKSTLEREPTAELQICQVSPKIAAKSDIDA